MVFMRVIPAKLICTQAGSPLPPNSPASRVSLLAGSAFTSTRVTEGFADSFGPKSRFAESERRHGNAHRGAVLGFPAGAGLFVPTVVAGSDATQPTAGGDLGLAASGGKYTPGAISSLLLSFVQNADANGAGGTPLYLPGRRVPAPWLSIP